MKIKIIGLLTAALMLKTAFAQVPTVYLLDPAHMANQQKAYKQGKADVMEEVNLVISKASETLAVKPQSVIDKSFTPPSGSKHDYMSLAPYFWPDPSKPDGLPYIRKDGQHNPEIKKITDHTYLSDLDNRCKYLALAYYFTGDDKYAAKAKLLLDVWFLNADTKMNPNLNYAQAIRGVNDGRGIGIIETRSLANLADWMGLMAGSRSFTNTDLDKMKTWYNEYLVWLQNSKNGKDEHNAKNNHGTHYDTQVAVLALFTGHTTIAKQILESDKKRIAVQIEPDGQQKLELERTNAYGYSTMNLNGWLSLAMLGDKTGVDIGNYSTADGRSLKKAVDYLLPYALDEKAKDHQQIGSYNKDEFYRVLILAGKRYNDKLYLKKAALIAKDDDVMLTNLLYN
jgi:hypothetical protein